MLNIRGLNNMDQIFQRFKEIKPKISSSKMKRFGILNFQERILELINVDMPILEQMNYLNIVAKNIENFMIERVPEIRSHKEFKIIIKKIKIIMNRIDQILKDRITKYNLQDKFNNHLNCCLVKYLYIAMQQSCYAEETDNEKIREQLEILANENKPCIGLTDTQFIATNNTAEYNIIYWFICPRSFLLIDEYIKIFKSSFKDSNSIDSIVTDLPIKFKYELDKGEEYLIRCPYDNYDLVLNFVSEMCSRSNEIHTIWITLYRVNPKDSKIVSYLKDAARLGKRVFVFIELNSKGDELNNYNVCKELKAAGCNVKTDYFGYKVHGKIFLAMDNNGNLYGHVGTGNYNEKTAKQYTDIHYITSKHEITREMLNIVIALFEKRIYRTNIDDPKIFSSPMNIRPMIIKMIEEEIRKCEQGRIYIKVNNLCDEEIMGLLYDAARHGVDVKIICRTTCTLNSMNNLEIRSKAGIYLEHDRIYIFGDRTFIGSADLLFRNISKRFEIMCEIEKENIYEYFMNVWDDRPIFTLSQNHNWRLLS